MTTRAKMKVTSITEVEGGNKIVKMNCVYSQTGENADYTKYSPSGNFEIQITPETKAYDFFKVSKCYYFDISEAPENT